MCIDVHAKKRYHGAGTHQLWVSVSRKRRGWTGRNWWLCAGSRWLLWRRRCTRCLATRWRRWRRRRWWERVSRGDRDCGILGGSPGNRRGQIRSSSAMKRWSTRWPLSWRRRRWIHSNLNSSLRVNDSESTGWLKSKWLKIVLNRTKARQWQIYSST